MSERICSVEGCEKEVRARGWCSTHWLRWRKHGDPTVNLLPRRSPVCSVEGCDRKHHALGLCVTHHTRWMKHGDTTVVLKGGPAKKERITYNSAHGRVRRERGPASAHLCIDCGQQAEQWSYNHSGVGELVGFGDGYSEGYELAYSTDPMQYEPRCKPCHTRYDSRNAA